MKINPLTQAFERFTGVREKKDSDGGSRDEGRSKKDGSKDEKEERRNKTPKQFESEVVAAVQAFGADSQALAQGLSANQIGRGPGLKVVLKDGTGAVVRQFTGEEFLQMREAATDGRLRGKLLDKKL